MRAACKYSKENTARREPERADARARCRKYTQPNYSLRRSTGSTTKTRTDRVIRGPICHGKKKGEVGALPSSPSATLWGPETSQRPCEGALSLVGLLSAKRTDVEEEPGTELGISLDEVVEAADDGDDGDADRLEEGGWG